MGEEYSDLHFAKDSINKETAFSVARDYLFEA